MTLLKERKEDWGKVVRVTRKVRWREKGYQFEDLRLSLSLSSER